MSIINKQLTTLKKKTMEIKKGIPIPKIRVPKQGAFRIELTELFNKMEIGDSIEIPTDKYFMYRKVVNELFDKVFTSRKDDNDVTTVWRTL
jgi:hypothetical protein